MTRFAKMKINLIAAVCLPSRGIGLRNALPWPKLADDLRRFRELTTRTDDPKKQNAVIMGANTWASLPRKLLPLRLNLVVSRRLDLPFVPSVLCVKSLREGVDLVQQRRDVERLFVIGGGMLFGEAMRNLDIDTIYLTEIMRDFKADVFLPPLPASFLETWRSEIVIDEPSGTAFQYAQFDNMDHMDDEGDDFFLKQEADDAPPINAKPKLSKEEIDARVNAADLCMTLMEQDLKAFPTMQDDLDTRADEEFVHVREGEQQYLDMCRDVLRTGSARNDRTGVGTLSKFGFTLRYQLQDGFPLLTTRRVFFAGVVAELEHFLKGKTDAKLLDAQKVRIWNGNTSRAALDRLGFHDRAEGDMGPVYGFQWRHWGAPYTGCEADYTGQGIDQLAQLVKGLQEDPHSRRHVLSAWNVAQLPDMVLPPCHVVAQFYVADGKLSCMLYQRSCDLALGYPFNVASYALLTHLLAQICDLQVGELVHVIGDAHLYKSHLANMRELLSRSPRPFPRLRLNPFLSSLDEFHAQDAQLEDYDPHPALNFPMAV